MEYGCGQNEGSRRTHLTRRCGSCCRGGCPPARCHSIGYRHAFSERFFAHMLLVHGLAAAA